MFTDLNSINYIENLGYNCMAGNLVFDGVEFKMRSRESNYHQSACRYTLFPLCIIHIPKNLEEPRVSTFLCVMMTSLPFRPLQVSDGLAMGGSD